MSGAGAEILIATGNPGKFREICAVLSASAGGEGPLEVRWRSLLEFGGIEEPHEDGRTFAENARLKAIYYSRRTGLWTLADDSGLEVDALGGEPGVRSARYAGVTGDRRTVDRANNRKLIAALAGTPPERRTARFRCALALADGNRILAEAEGYIEGRIVDGPRGSGGFGYDPHFFVEALGRATAELSGDEKNRVSHRGQALRRMRERIAGLLSAARTTNWEGGGAHFP